MLGHEGELGHPLVRVMGVEEFDIVHIVLQTTLAEVRTVLQSTLTERAVLQTMFARSHCDCMNVMRHVY